MKNEIEKLKREVEMVRAGSRIYSEMVDELEDENESLRKQRDELLAKLSEVYCDAARQAFLKNPSVEG